MSASCCSDELAQRLPEMTVGVGDEQTGVDRACDYRVVIDGCDGKCECSLDVIRRERAEAFADQHDVVGCVRHGGGSADGEVARANDEHSLGAWADRVELPDNRRVDAGVDHDGRAVGCELGHPADSVRVDPVGGEMDDLHTVDRTGLVESGGEVVGRGSRWVVEDARRISAGVDQDDATVTASSGHGE
ncbi:MAG: hypothetical protein R2743_19905 [Ilumatobacteraceae bacterium]